MVAVAVAVVVAREREGGPLHLSAARVVPARPQNISEGRCFDVWRSPGRCVHASVLADARATSNGCRTCALAAALQKVGERRCTLFCW